MRRIDVEHVVPGMMTARHVYPPGEFGGVPLLAGSVIVTEALRDRLLRSGIDAIYIDDELSEGIEQQRPITDETRKQALQTVKSTFAKLKDLDSTLGRQQVVELESTISVILNEIAGRRNLLVCLSDLDRFGGDRFEHAINVCVTGLAIAKRYFEEHGWRDFKGQRRQDGIGDRMQKLGIGLMLQDIGLLAVPEAVMEKRGILTAEERAIMQQHPLYGIDMLKGSDISPLVTVTIAQHHERFDGSGYPRGLSGEDLHDHGQIAAIAEAYVSLGRDDATGTRTAFEPHIAYDLITRAGGKLFAPEVVDAFRASVAPYGPTTCVQLSDGRFGIVESINPQYPLLPKVRITHDPDGMRFMPALEVDLSRADGEIAITKAVGTLPGDADIPVHA